MTTTLVASPADGDSNLGRIIKQIDQLTVLELAELVHALEDKYGVSAKAPVAIQTGPVQSVDVTPAKTEFDVKLTGFDAAKKIAVIKAVRELTGLALTEAKTAVESSAVLKAGVPTTEAEAMKTKLEAVGATVSLL